MTPTPRLAPDRPSDAASVLVPVHLLKYWRAHIASLEARLAALAGAGPDCITCGKPLRADIAINACHCARLTYHAPAKAREVTEADVERALRAPYGDGDVSDMLRGGGDEETAIMRAALATFAEGAE